MQQLVKTIPITTSILRMSSLRRHLTSSPNSSSNHYSVKLPLNAKWTPLITNSNETCQMKHAERSRSRRRNLPVRLGPLIASPQGIFSHWMCLTFENPCFDITINTIQPTWCLCVLLEIILLTGFRNWRRNTFLEYKIRTLSFETLRWGIHSMMKTLWVTSLKLCQSKIYAN